MSRIERVYVVCDRCGKETLANDIPDRVAWLRFQSFNYGRSEYIDGDKRYDLCQECELDLIDWMDERRNEEEVSP